MKQTRFLLNHRAHELANQRRKGLHSYDSRVTVPEWVSGSCHTEAILPGQGYGGPRSAIFEALRLQQLSAISKVVASILETSGSSGSFLSRIGVLFKTCVFRTDTR